ncbi:Dockerin type I repeat protein [Novipirellula aureliae]|uniref:Dockerin type I repeat protein n=1 Tax=Novipirellula aureliae TaxID=2527966 RepID=A0A5C6DX73_9BACT|nr:dockerin type I domain-containing protein [Novipirellula aureliae]TWU41340.1 Dockerin type I repeat protein [Novipirellula aureliae]
MPFKTIVSDTSHDKLKTKAKASRRAKRRRRFGRFETLEPRLPLSASSIDGRAFVDVGPSDNVALDQPRVTVQFLTEEPAPNTEPAGNTIVGPNTLNSWLLDTGANTTLVFQSAVDDMTGSEPTYETVGKFEELGVGGSSLFDISESYVFDFAGASGQRNRILDTHVISNPDKDVSIFGPYGIVGMPAMTERVTTVDFTPWTTVVGTNLFLGTDFHEAVPEPAGERYTVRVDNRVEFFPDDAVVEGDAVPAWADLPFLTAEIKSNDLTTQGNFLFDTGAQVSILSNQLAFDVGLDTNGDGVLDQNDAGYARSETISGISGSTSVPVFLIDEVHVPTTQGPDLVWTDLQWLILDIHPDIEGIFGFDNMTSGWVEGLFQDGQSGYIMQSHFDFRGWEATGQGELHFDLNPEYATLVDPNGPGASVVESGGVTIVSETGVDDTYQIRLTEPPLADVTVSFTGHAGQVDAVDANNLANHFVVFTTQNWNIPQTVRVRAIDDSDAESYRRSFIRQSSTSTDPNYDGVGMPRISVGVIDDDYAGVMLIPSDGDTTVYEAGSTDYYDVVLTTAPTESVSIQIEQTGGQITAVSETTGSDTLIFGPGNWSQPQRVRVTAVDDLIAQGDHFAYLSHKINTTDLSYAEAFLLQEKVTIVDNDSLESSVMGRWVAYGGTTADYGEDAIDTSKTALRTPGTLASMANYTNYMKGLNRVMIDIANLPTGTLNNVSDFEFRVGNTEDPSDWDLLSGDALPTILPAVDLGDDVSRVTLSWADDVAIKNRWLQVTVNPTDDTGLAVADVFYFGNQGADVDGSVSINGTVTVNVFDSLDIRFNQSPRTNSVGINHAWSVYDIDRSGSVNVFDMLDARFNQMPSGGLRLITLPLAPPSQETPSLAMIQQNQLNPLDVNDDGIVSALDALIGINYLNQPQASTGVQSVAAGESVTQRFHDVNGDGQITALDSLIVINHLGRTSTAEPEPNGAWMQVMILETDDPFDWTSEQDELNESALDLILQQWGNS